MANVDLLETIVDSFPDHSIIKIDGFNDCIIGYVFQDDIVKLVYSQKKIINSLKKDGMTSDEALEFFYHNISDTYVGIETPIICNDKF